MLSQFTDRGTLAGGGEARATLSDYIDVPGACPAGRLDRDSDGLLILTDDGALQGRISSPKHTTPQTYLAQVEGEPNVASLDRLGAGVMLNDGPTRPATVRRIDPPRRGTATRRCDTARACPASMDRAVALSRQYGLIRHLGVQTGPIKANGRLPSFHARCLWQR
ncbi:hypothetical protein GCM10011393_39840 [Sphingopyxis bauzanensis]|nr:pseudouridine synthase [Sphingopyxis bauzanensis]GGJ65541.1 hypothetical protein GCM10011393_39840 [Sphingopyxis bauzanensis]